MYDAVIHRTILSKRGWRVVVMIVLGVWWTTMVRAQPDSSAAGQDFTALSPEQLMTVEVIPIDASGSHIHAAGEWMVGYRYGYARMEGHGHGVVEGSGTTAMDMTMHMTSVMYGVSNRLTLMAMVPYGMMTMQREGTAMSSSGIGDVRLDAHFAIRRVQPAWLIATLGLSLPTGSIDEASADGIQRLAPLMQPGSGTFALHPGFDIIRQGHWWTLGMHTMATLRLGTNERGYRRGHVFHAGGWVNWTVRRWIAPYIHVHAHHTTALHIRDNGSALRRHGLNSQANSHVEVQPGLSLYVPTGPLKGQRLEVEVPVPFLDVHEGPHMKHRWRVQVGWQWTL